MTHKHVPVDNLRFSRKPESLRFIGVDIARFLAIVGMIASHVVAVQKSLPGITSTDRAIAEIADQCTDGIASALFAVLGGSSIVFATRKLTLSARAPAVAAVAIRGSIVLIIGLCLSYIDYGIVIVLVYYGAAMIIVSPLVLCHSWVLGGVAAVLTLCFGWINAVVRTAVGTQYEGGQITWTYIFEDPVVGLRSIFVTGAYPALTWATYLIYGMLIGRLLLRTNGRDSVTRVAVALISCGVACACLIQLLSQWATACITKFFGVVGREATESFVQYVHEGSAYGSVVGSQPVLQLVTARHSGSAADILSMASISMVVIGVLVLVFDRGAAGEQTVLKRRKFSYRVVGVLKSAGAASLTIYSLHVVFTAWVSIPFLHEDAEVLNSYAEMPWWVAGSAAFWFQIVGALLIGALLSEIKKRGPLESLVSHTVMFLLPKQDPASLPPRKTDSHLISPGTG